MNNLINFSFIAKLEGGLAIKGYVPDPDGGSIESGVTVGPGFDIGQFSVHELKRMLPDNSTLANKLAIYTGMSGATAQKFLANHPLIITEKQGEIIAQAVKADAIDKLVDDYNKVGLIKFEYLPEPVRTVAASVSFQYGDLPTRCPKFFDYFVKMDYQGMHRELMNFGDSYPTRRNHEADYLSKIFIER